MFVRAGVAAGADWHAEVIKRIALVNLRTSQKQFLLLSFTLAAFFALVFHFLGLVDGDLSLTLVLAVL